MDWGALASSGAENYQDFLVPAMFAPLAERLVELAGVKKGARVLDVACGTGALTRVAAKAAGKKGSVPGVDLAEPNLTVARAIAEEKNAAPITYLQGDATLLPVDDAAFDNVFCQQGLQFFGDRAGGMAELRRAAAPGATLAVATWTGIEGKPFAAVEAALAEHIGTDAAEMMRSPFSVSAAELAQLVAMAGFDELEVSQETIECTWASHSEFAERALAAGPIAPRFAAATDEQRKAVNDAVSEALSEYATPEGQLRRTMTTNVAIAKVW